MPNRLVWLDCDPGHDDAMAILLAVHCSNIQLLGISTCHGNAPPQSTHVNAVRLLHAFAAPVDVHAHRGAVKPLIRLVRADPEIHGDDGLGGVEELLPDLRDSGVHERWQLDGRRNALDGMTKAVKNSWLNGHKVCLVSTGPMTNIALFFTIHPELTDAVEEIVFMGGGVGVGNRSAAAEYNILCDPEAAQIVLNVPVKKTMIPLNVTHTAIFTSSIHRRLLNPASASEQHADEPSDPTSTVESMPQPLTPLRHVISTIILYFAASYKETFNFVNGPPIHDALTIAYLSRPEIFKTKRYRVDVELEGKWTTGETVVDMWGYRDLKNPDEWGEGGKNCLVAEWADVPEFFNLLLRCVEKCDRLSPLNKNEG